MGKGVETADGNATSPSEIMHYLRALMQEFQKETGHQYNLEATPAEGTSYRLAKLDKERYSGHHHLRQAMCRITPIPHSCPWATPTTSWR